MKDNKFKFFKGVRNCFNIIYLYDKKYLLFSVFIAIFQGIVPSISLTISKKIINSMQLSSVNLNQLLTLLILYLIINIFPSIIFSFYSFYKEKFHKNFEKYIEILMLEKSLNLKLSDFEDDNTYDMINRAQSQKGFNITLLYDNVVSILREIISILSLILVLAQFKAWLILIIIIVPILKSLYSISLAKEQYNISISRTCKERKAWYIDYLISKGHAYKEIVLFGIGPYLIEKFKSLKDTIITQDINISKKNFKADLLCTILDSIISALIICFIIIQGLLKKILIGDATTYIQAAQSIKGNIESVFSILTTIIQDILYTELLFKYLSYNETESTNNPNDEIYEINTIEKIELINISYKYAHATEYSLKNINLIIEKNKPISILGKNGSGKTTLLKIILGFYDDYEGLVLVNGKNLKSIKKSSYMKKLTCLFQDYVKYEATLKDNIALDSVTENNIEEQILSKLKKVKLKPQIYKKEGLNTVLGNWFGKKQLSMGEWQRVAIARALMKNADVYIFDEPDASLDSESSNDLLSLYKNTFKDKIGIFITHNIPHASKITTTIAVLENGVLVEIGDHNSLIKKKGVYSNLFYNCK